MAPALALPRQYGYGSGMRALGWVTLSVTVALGCATVDDGFHARAVQGCHSDAECAGLAAEAENRFRTCSDANRECWHERDDMFTAHGWQNRQRITDAAATQALAESDLVAASGEAQRLDALGDSCEDIAALAAVQAGPNRPALVADVFHKTAAQRREARVRVLSSRVLAMVSAQIPIGDTVAARASVRGIVEVARDLADQIRCYDASAADQQLAEIDHYVAGFYRAVSAEEWCQASAACTNARTHDANEAKAASVAKQLCTTLAERKDYSDSVGESLAAIARERRNPAGVVDLHVLHELGEQVQDGRDGVARDNGMIASLRSQYVTLVHRVYNEKGCPR